MHQQTLIDKAKAAYLGLAIGDALGATVEFMTSNEIKMQYGIHREIIGGGWLKLKAGEVTDDTTMSLALGDTIVTNKSVVAADCAEAFLQWMRSKPVDIGNTVRRGLVRYRHKGLVHGEPCDYDAGNGACMRTLPIALWSYGHQAELIAAASDAQAHVTHHNPVSDAATQLVIVLVHGCLDQLTLNQLQQQVEPFINDHPQFQCTTSTCNNPSGYVVETLQAVLQAVMANDDFESTLIDVVNRGGDADTTGAIAGMIAGAQYGTESIPLRWLARIKPEIVERCQQQAEALIKLSVGFAHS